MINLAVDDMFYIIQLHIFFSICCYNDNTMFVDYFIVSPDKATYRVNSGVGGGVPFARPEHNIVIFCSIRT